MYSVIMIFFNKLNETRFSYKQQAWCSGNKISFINLLIYDCVSETCTQTYSRFHDIDERTIKFNSLTHSDCKFPFFFNFF